MKIDKSLQKVAIIVGIIVVLLIPSLMIQGIISERQHYSERVKKEVKSSWSKEQIIAGPSLLIPFKEHYYETIEEKNEAGKTTYKKIKHSRIKYLHILPDQLKIDGEIIPVIRKRSLYEVVLYKSDLKLSGNFSYPDFGLKLMKSLPMLFFGGTDSHTFMHYDIDLANIFHFHFEGKKQCILFDQKQSDFLYKIPHSLIRVAGVHIGSWKPEKNVLISV